MGDLKIQFRLCLFAVFVSGFAPIFFSGVSGASSGGGDASVMVALRDSLNPPVSLGWSDPDPCQWKHVGCSDDGRVTRIQIGHQGLGGWLPESLRNLTGLERLELQFNAITGPLPSLNGLSSLEVLMLSHNQFTSIPGDFFAGMTSLQSVEIDNNPFSAWEIPESLRTATALQNFSANSANLTGTIPEFLGADEFPGLIHLHLAFNTLSGGLPKTLSGSQIQTLWVNGQNLAGDIDVIGNMTSLQEVWLHSNSFSGPLPDFSGLKDLEILSLRDNQFTGPVPASLINLQSLKIVNLTNNLLQGPFPEFKTSVDVDDEISGESNRFCLSKPGDCDPEINTLLLISKSMNYPQKFAENWRGNDPCNDWIGITCSNGNITVLNFEKMGLNGTISPEFASLKSLQRLVLSGNNLAGTIPTELAALPLLTLIDLSNNRLHGKIPNFKSNLIVKTAGNPDIGKEKSNDSPPGPIDGPSSGSGIGRSSVSGRKKSSTALTIVLAVIGGLVGVIVVMFLVLCAYKRKQKRFARVQSPTARTVIHPRNSGSDDNNNTVKITVAGSSVTINGINEPRTDNDIQMVESNNMVISIQVLRNVTNNFSSDNILGRGGFGTVYKGELHDGTMIAVKKKEVPTATLR